MELRDYVRVLRKSWALILAVTIVGIALGVGLTLLTTKVYQASTQVFVSSNSTDTSTASAQTSNFIEARVASYPNLATSPAVLAQVLDDADVKAALAKTHRTGLRAATGGEDLGRRPAEHGHHQHPRRPTPTHRSRRSWPTS